MHPQLSNNPGLDHLARELRAAALASDHDKAARLSVEYTEAVREYWVGLPAGQRAGSALPSQSLELLRWVREMTIMQRGMTAEHLRLAAKASRYQTARALYLQSAALEAR
jgi:hypothetical protein